MKAVCFDYLWCGGIFNDCFIADFVEVCQWKYFQNWSVFDKDMN